MELTRGRTFQAESAASALSVAVPRVFSPTSRKAAGVESPARETQRELTGWEKVARGQITQRDIMSSYFILQVIGDHWTSYAEYTFIFISDWSILKAGNKKESQKWFECQNLWTVCFVF